MLSRNMLWSVDSIIAKPNVKVREVFCLLKAKFTHYSSVMRLWRVLTLLCCVPLKSCLYWFNLMKLFFFFFFVHPKSIPITALNPAAISPQGRSGITRRGRSAYCLTECWKCLFVIPICVFLFTIRWCVFFLCEKTIYNGEQCCASSHLTRTNSKFSSHRLKWGTTSHTFAADLLQCIVVEMCLLVGEWRSLVHPLQIAFSLT